MVKRLTSPGVQVFERNFSFYAPNATGLIPGIVGFASKGPIPSQANDEEPTLITSAEQLVKVFGRPDATTGGQGLIGALEILEKTDRIYYVRAATASATAASANVDMGTCPAIFLSGANGTDLTLTLNVSGSDGTLANPTQIEIDTTTDSSSDWADEFGADFNAALGGGDVATFIKTGTNTGYIVGSYAGSGSRLNLSANWSATTVSAALYNPQDGSTGLRASAASSITASGGTFDGFKYHIDSIYKGAGYNYSAVEVGGTTKIYGAAAEVDSLAGPLFTFVMNNDGSEAELFSMSMVPSAGSFPTKVINSVYDKFATSGSELVTSKLQNSAVDYTLSTSTWDASLPDLGLRYDTTLVSTTSNGGKFMKPIGGTFNMSGGVNGDQTGTSVAAVKAAIIGTEASKSGMYALDNESLPITIGLVPGYTDQDIQNALITLAESTEKFLAVIAPPLGLESAQEALDWTNGKGNGRTAAINSSWAATYWPYVRVYDVFARASVWLDPSIYATAQMCETAATTEMWFAPAGLRRGRLTKPTDVEVVLNVGDRNALYSPGNIVNPIQKFVTDGIVIWGQRTSTRLASALDRVNVRFLYIYLRQAFLQATRGEVFQPSDPVTWLTIKNIVDAILRDVQRRRGVIDFRTVVDETVNTPIRRDRNEMWARVMIEPTKAGEIINFELNLTNQGQDFGT